MALVTLDKFKRAIGVDDNAQDQRLQDALDDASSAVKDYAQRDFGSVVVPGDKTLYYSNSGVLNIPDASAVTVVRFGNAATPLDVAAWEARDELPAGIYTWLELPVTTAGISPEMGFTYNLDNYARPQNFSIPVVVTASWGWFAVPGAVQRATMFAAASMLSFPAVSGAEGGAALASESIADMARAYMVEQQVAAKPEGLPPRAQTLLDPYRRVSM